MSLTPQQKTDHIKAGAQKCPFCGTDDGLNYDNVVDDAGTCHQGVRCYNCGNRWEEVYEMIDVRELDDEGSYVEAPTGESYHPRSVTTNS